MPTVNRTSLLQLLDEKLSAEDVAALIFDLALDQANVEGTIKRARLRSLIDYYERRDQMDRLIAAVTALRPDVLAPDTVYVAPIIDSPILRWWRDNGRRWSLVGIILVLVLATALIAIPLLQPRPPDDVPTIASLTQIIAQQPTNATAYLNRGDLYREQNDYDRAIADYTQAITYNPDLPDAYRSLGICYGATGDYSLALDSYTKSIDLQANPYALLERGSLYARQRKLDNAINDFSDAIRLKPDLAAAYYARGLAYREIQQNDKAIADFNQVVNLDNDPDVRKSAEQALRALIRRP